MSPVHKFTWNKTYTNIEHNIFEELSPFGITPVKKHIRPGHAGVVDHSVDLWRPDFKKSIKKECTEAINFVFNIT